MREIPLSQGLVALVDDCDYELLARHNWHAARNGRNTYAQRAVRRSDGGWTKLGMHRALNLWPDAEHVDHINGDGLDNRRANLRPATVAENQRNHRRRSDNTSGYIGVALSSGKWRAQINVDGQARYIGYYSTPEEAARARDAAAVEHHGEFARLNFGGTR